MLNNSTGTIDAPTIHGSWETNPKQRVEENSHQNPDLTLRTYALASLASLIVKNDAPSPNSPEAIFLIKHLDAVSTNHREWAKSLPSYIQKPSETDFPVIRLVGDIGLTVIEMLAICLAAAVEENTMVGRAIAFLQKPIGGSRPTLGLLATAWKDILMPGVHPIYALTTGAAIQSGLLTLLGEGAPLPERVIAVPPHLGCALNGHDSNFPGVTLELSSIQNVSLPPSITQEAGVQAKGLLAEAQRVLVVRTGSLGEGRSVANLMAQAMHRRPVFIETEKTAGLSPWFTLRQLLPVFCFELAPGERKTLPSLPLYQGPILVLCGPDGSVESNGGPTLSWSLPIPPHEERQALWQKVLGNKDLATELARDHRHGSGRIAHLGRIAHHHRSVRGHTELTMDDIMTASWSAEGGGLETLAQPLPDSISDEALVVKPGLREELDILLLRCRVRDRLSNGLGASATARYRPGVKVLFVGPSGTGKTLAASWLATKLKLPLYRVDVASVISKYIGETEKNLAQLLARAEQAEVVLLFDEAESLFSKRTEVKDSNDRFANTQTNYLLQRIESFDGITILTSNSRSRFDSAFSRRLDTILEFSNPSPEERRALWLSHLGTHHRLAQKDLNKLAATANLCGGHIRNVVLSAAVLAQQEDRPIECKDIFYSLIGEYRKLGKQLPVELQLTTDTE